MRLRFRPQDADPHFVLLWLQSPQIRAYIRSRASGASPTMKKINQATVKELPFPEIELTEQRRILNDVKPILDALDVVGEMLDDAEEMIAKVDATLLRTLVPVIEAASAGSEASAR